MKKTYRGKIYFLFMLAILMFFSFTGCAKSVQTTGVDLDAKTYQASATDLGNAYIKDAVSDSDYIYILNNHENQNNIQKISFKNNNKTNLPLPFISSTQTADALAVDSAGNYLLLTSEMGGTGTTVKLFRLSAAGEIITEANLTQALGLTGYSPVRDLSVGQDDTVYLTVLETSAASSNTATTIYTLNNDLDKTAQLTTPDNVLDLTVSPENEIYLTVWGDSGNALKKADFLSGMTAELPFPGGINRDSIIGFVPGQTEGLLCADGAGLLAVDFSLGTSNRIFHWLDGNISTDGLLFFGQAGDDAYWAIRQTGDETYRAIKPEENDSETSAAELLTLTGTTYRELPTREYLTCATTFLSEDISDAIVAFNKSNKKYYINVREYLNDADPSDEAAMVAAMLRLHLDVMGNNPPDLLELHGVNFTQLAAKGAFCDLNPLIGRSRINPPDYLPFAFTTYTSEDKLYALFPGFHIRILVGPESKLGNLDRWTIAEMIAWAEKYPDAKLLKGNGMDIISLLLDSNYGQFVNWETGECSFNTPEFTRILEFAATFPATGEDRNNPDNPSVYDGITAGEYLLLPDFIFMLNRFYEHDAVFAGEARYIGYPVEKGSGILADPAGAFAIPAGAANQNGAFAFIEYLLSEEYQNNGKLLDSNIPVKRSALDAYAEKLKAEAYGMGERVPHGYNLDNLMVMIDLTRDEEYLALLMEIISRVDGVMISDEQILKIISEEAGSLFAGQKTAAEAAAIIQNRAQIYVNENR